LSDVGGMGVKGLESVSTGGEVNTGFNVGSGVGLIFRDKTGLLINFKSLIAGSGMTINNNPDDIELIASGAGEANTISSLGGGTVQLVATIPKLLVDLRVKSLSVSAPINVSDVSDLITLALDPLVNADISGAAAIALTKLAALTVNRALISDGSGVIAVSAVTATELALLSGATTLELQANKNIANGYCPLDASIFVPLANLNGILNAQIGAGAAIAYSKLNLTGLVVNADISGAAAILQSKLAALINANLPFGTAFQRKRTNAGATAIEDFTEEAALTFTIGDGISVIPTGVKLHIRVPFDFEVTRWTLLAKESGSIVVDVNEFTSLANFDSDTKASITGTDTPDLVADRGDDSTALTGWTTVLVQGLILEAEVDSATTITRVTLILRGNKRG